MRLYSQGVRISRFSKCLAAGVVVPTKKALIFRLLAQLTPAGSLLYQLVTSDQGSPDWCLALVGMLFMVLMAVLLLLAMFDWVEGRRKKWFVFASGLGQ